MSGSFLPLDLLDVAWAIRLACKRIAASWPELLAYEMSASPLSRGSSDGTPSLPGGTNRINLVDDTPRLLSRWCQEVRHVRDASPKRPGGPGMSDVPPMTRYLAEHAMTFAAAGIGPEVAAELTEVADAIAAHLAEPGPRRVPLGPCPVPACEGGVRAILEADARTDPPLVCSADPAHAWAPGSYLELAAAMGSPPPPPLEAPALASWLVARHGGDASVRRIEQWARFHPVVFARDGRGRFDPLRVAAWYIGRRADRASAGA